MISKRSTILFFIVLVFLSLLFFTFNPYKTYSVEGINYTVSDSQRIEIADFLENKKTQELQDKIRIGEIQFNNQAVVDSLKLQITTNKTYYESIKNGLTKFNYDDYSNLKNTKYDNFLEDNYYKPKINYNKADRNLVISIDDTVRSDFNYKVLIFKAPGNYTIPAEEVEIVGLDCRYNKVKNTIYYNLVAKKVNSKSGKNTINIACTINDIEPGQYSFQESISDGYSVGETGIKYPNYTFTQAI